MQPIAGIEDSLCDNIRCMKPAKPGFARLSEEDIAHLRDQCIRGVRTLREIQEPRIAGKVLAFDGGGQPFVLRLVHQGDHEPAIPCLIGARRYIECARSAPSRTCSATLWPSNAAVDCVRLTSTQRPVPTVARANSAVAMA